MHAMAIAAILAIAISLFYIIAMWKIFTKAGKAGWLIFIPIVNMYVMFDIVYGKGWKFLLLLVPFLNVIIEILFFIDLAKAYGKGTGFGIGLIFLGFIFIPILGYGSATYQPSFNNNNYVAA